MVLSRFIPKGGGIFRGVTVSALELSFLRSGVLKGLTLDQLASDIRTLRPGGLRRQALVRIRQDIRGITQAGGQLKNLPRNFKPLRRSIPTTPQRVYGKVIGYDEDAQHIKDIWVNFGTDTILTREEMEDRIAEIADGFVMKYGVEDYDIELTGIVRREDS